MITRTPRTAARVAILDADRAVLLLRYDNPEVGVHWAMPGGGLDPGEAPRDAARREVREETGWADIEPGELLCTWEHEFTRGTVPVRQYEYVFAGTLPPGERRRPLGPDIAAAHRADGILESRWWPPAALATTPTPLWPPNLPELLAGR